MPIRRSSTQPKAASPVARSSDVARTGVDGVVVMSVPFRRTGPGWTLGRTRRGRPHPPLMIRGPCAREVAMRRVIVSAGSGATVERADVPEPQAGEALVRTTLAGVCGSDTHALHG